MLPARHMTVVMVVARDHGPVWGVERGGGGRGKAHSGEAHIASKGLEFACRFSETATGYSVSNMTAITESRTCEWAKPSGGGRQLSSLRYGALRGRPGESRWPKAPRHSVRHC